MNKNRIENFILNTLGMLMFLLIILSILCCFYFDSPQSQMTDKDAEEIIMCSVIF